MSWGSLIVSLADLVDLLCTRSKEIAAQHMVDKARLRPSVQKGQAGDFEAVLGALCRGLGGSFVSLSVGALFAGWTLKSGTIDRAIFERASDC